MIVSELIEAEIIKMIIEKSIKLKYLTSTRWEHVEGYI